MWDSAVAKQSYLFINLSYAVHMCIYRVGKTCSKERQSCIYFLPWLLLRLYANNKYTIISKLDNK